MRGEWEKADEEREMGNGVYSLVFQCTFFDEETPVDPDCSSGTW